jgi:hypothetical protein
MSTRLHGCDYAPAFLLLSVFFDLRVASSWSSCAGIRPVARSGSTLRSVGEDGLELSIGVRPGPLLESSRRLLIGGTPFEWYKPQEPLLKVGVSNRLAKRAIRQTL